MRINTITTHTRTIRGTIIHDTTIHASCTETRGVYKSSPMTSRRRYDCSDVYDKPSVLVLIGRKTLRRGGESTFESSYRRVPEERRMSGETGEGGRALFLTSPWNKPKKLETGVGNNLD